MASPPPFELDWAPFLGAPVTETRATYFCVDIECNGVVPALYDMVSIGAVVVAPDASGALAIGEQLYLEIRPQAPRHDPSAARIHGLSLEHLNAHGLPRGEAMARLADWVKTHTLPGTEPVFVGHNAPFDWSFIAWTFHAEDMPNPFGYKALCTKALSMGALGLHWLDTNKELLATRLNLPAEDRKQKHDALYDAKYQALILIRLIELQGAAAAAR